MRYRVLISVMGSLLALATVAKAEQLAALLTGYEESPSVSTTASGVFAATIDEDSNEIFYTETFSGLQGTVTQSHIHIAQPGVNGSIVIFLCQTTANPDPTGLAPQCPQEGTVTGTITAANVIAFLAVHPRPTIHHSGSPGKRAKDQSRDRSCLAW
jgi:hypothetical protein